MSDLIKKITKAMVYLICAILYVWLIFWVITDPRFDEDLGNPRRIYK